MSKVDRTLIIAASNGDMATVTKLLGYTSYRRDINQHGGWDASGLNWCGTALQEAAYRGQALAVEALLGAGANASMKDTYGDTALVAAATNGRTRTVLAFLRARPGEALALADRETALGGAGRNGHAAVARFLCESLGRPFGPEQLAEIKQNALTYNSRSVGYFSKGEELNPDHRPLGGEQGTILVGVPVALISCCALPQGRGWVRRRIPLADSPTHGRAGTTNAVSLRAPGHRRRVRPRRAGPAGGEVRPASGRAPVLVLLLAQPGQPALHRHGLD
jgi:hypothetical protein